MHLTFRNVNEAFRSVVEGIDDGSIETIETPSRNGPVLQVVQPVIFTYTHPRERVLFNSVRDCNPFFHLYESLWMLAGRNDVAPLKYYASKIGDFSDDGTTFNGAYGYRWRNHPGSEDRTPNGQQVDQLKIIVEHLKRKPESRRVVLQMWNVEDDLLKIDSSKDVCCNTAVYFSIRTEKRTLTSANLGVVTDVVDVQCLDMTVTNRSNDIIWGMFGANAVHFSFLQEYIACALGIEVGHYHQFSNNAHIYTETNSGWHPDQWLKEYKIQTMHTPQFLSYGRGPKFASGNTATSPKLFAGDETVELFDMEVKQIVELNYNCDVPTSEAQSIEWKCWFLNRTVQPALHAFHCYKQRDFKTALEWCYKIAGADWRVACENWIQKRKANFEKKVKSDG